MKKLVALMTLALVLTITGFAMPDQASAYTQGNAPTVVFSGSWSSDQHVYTDDEYSWYKLVIPSDGALAMKLKNYCVDCSLAWVIRRPDSGDDLFDNNISWASTATSPAIDEWEVGLTKGVYYLGVREIWDDCDARFQYMIQFTSFGANDGNAVSFDSPQPYTLGQTITGLIGRCDTDDYFRVTLPKAGYYVFQNTSYNDGGYDYEVLTNDGATRVAYGCNYRGSYTSPNTDNDEIRIDSAGTYYIHIYNRYDWCRKYRFTLSPITPATCNHDYERVKDVKANYFRTGYSLYRCKKCGAEEKRHAVEKCKLGTPSLFTATGERGKISVSWWSVTDAKGYQVQYSLKKKMKKAKIKKFKGRNKTSGAIKKLKRNKVYYVRVRAYVKSGKKVAYGPWSRKCKVRVQ